MAPSKRFNPRIAVETLCSEVVAEREHFGLVVELSECGLRLQRPMRGRMEGRIVQIEFELPNADELVWAKGEICFDQLWQVPQQPDRHTSGLLRTSGVRIVAAAAKHLRMLRDWVVAERDAGRVLDEDPGFFLTHASHWSG